MRTTSSAVQAILGDDYASGRSLAGPLSTATVLVDRLVVRAGALGHTLAAAELELIERWLAAHFYAVSDKPYASNRTADASASYHGQTGKGLEATLYGQQAMLLDWTHVLATLNERKVAGALWLGRLTHERTDWEDRNR